MQPSDPSSPPNPASATPAEPDSAPATAYAAPPRGLSRRSWLRVVAGGSMASGGAALIVGLSWPLLTRNPAGSPESFEPNEYVRITPDGLISVVCGLAEMGQGVQTAFAMLLADELDADWRQVLVESPPASRVYNNPALGTQITAGSMAIRAHWPALRQAGAAARAMLITAAARQWQVDPASCEARNSVVIHPASQRRLAYGSLVAEASTLAVPKQVALKRNDALHLLGQSLPRLDTPAKVTGAARYGIDMQWPGLLVAVIERAPWPQAVPVDLDDQAARATPGVRGVITLPDGIAVVATGFWAAQKGRQRLRVKWRPDAKATGEPAGSGPSWSSDTFSTMLHSAAQGEGLSVDERGLPGELFDQSAPERRVESRYEVPYLAQACLEPMNCTAWVQENGAELWLGTQDAGAVQSRVAELTGLRRSAVLVHAQLLGGGFGRRLAVDMALDAARLSMRMGSAVKLIYSREDDMRGGHYRPAAVARVAASLTPLGQPDVLRITCSVPSVLAAAEGRLHDLRKADPAALEGLRQLPYAIGHWRLAHAPCEPGPKAGYWRSAGHSHNIFFLESFIDELAAAADQDPVHYRHQLLGGQPRLRAVLELASDKAQWGRQPKGRFQGVAVASSHGSHIAQIVDLSVSADGLLTLHRIVAAFDCGWVVNPDTVRAQVEGAIVFGLSAALFGQISFSQGRVQQGDFDTYPVLRLAQTPPIEVFLVPSTQAPGGAGEPGTAPIAAALANALHAATGQRLRRLPLLQHGHLRLAT